MEKVNLRTLQIFRSSLLVGMSCCADFNADGNMDMYMVGMGSTTARRLELGAGPQRI